MHFKVAIGEYLPFLKLEKENGIIVMSGPLADAFEMIAQKVNFTYTLYRDPHDTWGIKEPHGWTGLLGMVSRNEVDLALGPFTLTYSRWKDFEMSVPMYVDTVEILAPTFESKMSSLFNMLTVFNYKVWFLLIFTIVVLCLIWGYIESYENPYRKFKQGLFVSFWNVISTILQKGRLQRPEGYLLIVLSVTWMLSSIVINHYFSGMLLTNLLLKRGESIDSIEDLDAHETVQPILEHHSSVHAAFKDSTPEVYRSIFRSVEANPSECILTYKNMSTVGMNYVFRGTHALITDGMGLRTFLLQRIESRLPCKYRLAREQLWPLWKVLAFGHEFPKDRIVEINHVLRFLSESGWLRTMMMRKFSGFSQCLSSSTLEVQSLSLEHVRGTFIIWFLGCLTSVTVFFMELFFYDREQKRSKREKKWLEN